MIKSKAVIINKLGLHARAASKLVTTASEFSSDVRIRKNEDEQVADGKNIMSILMMAASKGTVLILEVDGKDQERACQAIMDLINRRFDEDE